MVQGSRHFGHSSRFPAPLARSGLHGQARTPANQLRILIRVVYGMRFLYCFLLLTSDGLKLRRLAVAENVGGAHRSMRLRQPSQKAWPHVTSMRGTTPSLRRTTNQSQSVPAAGGPRDPKTPALDLDLMLAYKT
jgi:hypothetical protein